MKKQLFLTLASISLLASCASQPTASSTPEASTYTLDLKVALPAGAPAVAFYRHLGLPASQLDVVAAENILGFISADSDKDIVIAPTNGAVNAIQNQGAPYKLAANITFGNFYIASTGHDSNGQIDADDYIVAFQQKQIPGKIFNYVYGDKGYFNIEWKDNAVDAKACLVSGIDTAHDNYPVDYVFLAEPAMSHAFTLNTNAREVANVQEDYAKKTTTQLVQASLFVRNGTDRAKVDALLASLQSDIEGFLANPSVIDPYTESLGENVMKAKCSVPATALLKSITENGKNRMGLGFKKASENKDAVNNFLSMFNITVNEETYYQ